MTVTDSSRALTPLRLATWMLLTGQLLYIIVTQFHSGGDANDHQAIFAHYAEDGAWSPVHIGQFLGMALLLGGLIVLNFAFESQNKSTAWLARCGVAVAAATLALYGALQAVDGVALKQAVVAWTTAPEAEKATRFATAEAIRWLEWGMRSYQDFMLGMALLICASALASVRSPLRRIAVLVGLSGAAYLAQGWFAGTEGFSPNQSIAIVAGWTICLIWMIWLAVVAERSGNAFARSHEAGNGELQMATSSASI